MALATDSPWQAIAAAALLGTERQPLQLPNASGKLGHYLSQLGERPSEATLLSAAGMIALHQQVGWLPETRSLAPAVSCSLDDLPRCSPRAIRCLQQILEGQFPQLLNEWLEKAAIAGQRVPEMLLPSLLDKGRQQRELRTAILPVLGRRGQWLAMQNPDWSYAIALTTESDWETGTSEARLTILQHLRLHTPDRASALLQTTWGQEPAGDRAKFLETLRIGLSMADEPFLEAALGDRSKEVRRVAFDLLASLPDSRLCKHITDYSCRYLSVENKTSLQVQLPDRLDETLVQLGIELKPSAAVDAKLGEKAWWLLQMIGATPLNTWTDRWQMSPQEIVALTRSHDWQIVILDGLALAAKRQGKPEWLEAIFKLWFAGQASVREAALINLSVEDLFNTLPPDRRDAFLIDLLQFSQTRINESLTIWLLRSSPQQWSIDLARMVVECLEKHLSATTPSYSDWELRTTCKEFGRFIPIVLISEVIQLREQLANSSPWMQSIDELLVSLQFRQEMAQAFKEDGG